jgi:hypothetical protein
MMFLLKLSAIAILAVVFFIFRKWFLKHYYFLLAFIPIIVLILYADYFIQLPVDKKRNESAELEKWKEEHKDNFITQDKINTKDSAISRPKIGDVLYDTTFIVNSLKVHYKEYLVALPESEYSYDSTRVVLTIKNNGGFVVQTINEDIYAIGSPIDKEDWYNIIIDDGIFQDYNFDGYLDLILRIGNAPNNHALNGYFYIYLFDPPVNMFIKYDRELTNPSPNTERKEVECKIIYSTVNPSTETEYYKWVNGELEITESIAFEQLYEQPEKDVIRTKETKTLYKNGVEISRTERIIEDKIN